MLFSKDEPLRTSYPNVGFLILRLLRRERDRRASLYEISEKLKKDGVSHVRQLIFGILFLYAAGLIEFNSPFVELTDAAFD